MASRGNSEAQSMYRHSAEWFDIRYAQKDYAVEAARLCHVVDRVHPRAATLLDVACGTGRHLEHLSRRYRVEGLDCNTEMLRMARSRLPEVPLVEANMCDFHLGRLFDIVTCFFASFPYVVSVARMRQAMSRMAEHLAPGGLLFVEPGLTPSAYRENEVVHNFRRTPERAISWMYVMRRNGPVAVWDIHWLVGSPDEGVSHFVEHEEFGLFTTEECTRAMGDAGLDVLHHARGLHGYGAFFGRGRPWSPEERAAIDDVLAG